MAYARGACRFLGEGVGGMLTYISTFEPPWLVDGGDTAFWPPLRIMA